VLDEEDPALLVAALGDVARLRGMTRIARETVVVTVVSGRYSGRRR